MSALAAQIILLLRSSNFNGTSFKPKMTHFLIFQTYVKDDVVASRTFKRVWIRNGAKKSLTDYFLLNSSMETSSSAGIEPVTV